MAAAVGCGLYLQLGASVSVSAGCALATYLLLITLHMLRAASLRAKGQSTEASPADEAADPSKQSAPAATAQRPQPKAATVEPQAMNSKPQAAPATSKTFTSPPLPASTASYEAPPPSARVQAPPLQPQSARRGAAGGDEMGHAALQDFWAYRPSDPSPQLPMQANSGAPRSGYAVAQTPVVTPAKTAAHRSEPMRPSSKSAPPARVRPSMEPPQAALREADVEMIQSLIKKLADEVNAADAIQTLSPPQMATGAFDLRKVPSNRGEGLATLSRPSEAVEASLDALRATAGTMRQAASRATAPPLAELRSGPMAQEPARNMPPPVRPGHFKLAAIAEAVHSGRVDVLLEPIMGLGDLRARHYEVSVRLLDPAGGVVAVDATDPSLGGTNLLPLLDLTLLERTASVAERLDERGKTGAVFSAFSGEALTDESFVAGAAESCREREAFSGQLVLTFAQSAIRMLSETQWRSLFELRSLGFRFALGDLTDLDMDFERLADTGFAFVKLDANVFLQGLRSPHGSVPSSDICGYLARLGYTLIADHIDSEYERSQLFGFGVLFGQGELFGGPRPMKTDALTGARHAA